MVFYSVSRREGAGELASFDNSSSSLLDSGDEIALEPVLTILENFCNWLAPNCSISNIRELSGGVVAPDDHVLDLVHIGRRALGDLEHGSVMVETGESREVLLGDFGSILGKSEAVGVCGVGNHEAAAGGLGDLVESSALLFEDFGIDLEQLLALHSLLSGEASYENAHIDILEHNLGVGAHDHALQQRVRAVIQLHLYAFQSLLGRCDLEKVQHDRLVFAKHFAGAKKRKQCVANLTSGASHADVQSRLGVVIHGSGYY